MDKYIVYHEEFGVFVGFALGLAFWSKLDPGGQVTAPVYNEYELEEAFDLLQTADLKACKVTMDIEGEEDYVSMDACIGYW